MKFIFCGYDLMLPCARRLIDDGHELIGIFSFDCDNIFNFNIECQALANQNDIPFTTNRINDTHIETMPQDAIDIIFAAGYPFKIPNIPTDKARGINMHPSHLPRARGIMPVPYILLDNNQDAAGLTIHKITDGFDEGDILAQARITLSAQETVETYCAKSLLLAPDMISKIFADLDTAWNNATAQDETIASHHPPPDEAMRTLDWTQSVHDILATARAFGRFGCLAHFDDSQWSIFEISGWEDSHNHPPGTCIALQPKLALIAAKDGYITLKDFLRMETQTP